MSPDVIEIRPVDVPPEAVVRVPGSKSYTNRALLAAALAEGTSRIGRALFSDDTRHMAACLRAVGIGVEADEATTTFEVVGRGGDIPVREADLFVGNAGTVARFLPPFLALGNGEFRIDGVPRMRERPMRPLIAALRELGGDVESIHGDGSMPLQVHATGLEGGSVQLAADVSSQFISGLLLAGPYMRRGLELEIVTHTVSRPYLDMTVATMSAFGVAVGTPGPGSFVVPEGRYLSTAYEVEPDASAASYFFAAAALTGGTVRVEGLGRDSLQGDLGFVDILEMMGASVVRGDDHTTVTGPADGALRGVTVDMADLSDVAQTLAAVAPFASTQTRVTGIGFVRAKETDRIAATVTELRRLGVDAEEEADGFVVRPSIPRSGTVRTYDDHRMAMSFAVVGLRVPGIRIADPQCCAKTFPDFFEVLADLRGHVGEIP